MANSFLWSLKNEQSKPFEPAANDVTGRFTKFVVVGIGAAAINIVSRAIFSQFVIFEIAVVLAFPVALTFAFLLSRHFVFEQSEHQSGGQYARFAVVNLVALVQVWLVTISFNEWLLPYIGWTWHAELLAHAIGVGSPILSSYYAHKYYTFRLNTTPPPH